MLINLLTGAVFMQVIGHLLRSLYDLVTNYLVKAYEIQRL